MYYHGPGHESVGSCKYDSIYSIEFRNMFLTVLRIEKCVHELYNSTFRIKLTRNIQVIIESISTNSKALHQYMKDYWNSYTITKGKKVLILMPKNLDDSHIEIRTKQKDMLINISETNIFMTLNWEIERKLEIDEKKTSLNISWSNSES